MWDNENISNVSVDNNTISTTIDTPSSRSNIRKRNINKPNPKGETPLHVACLKVSNINIFFH